MGFLGLHWSRRKAPAELLPSQGALPEFSGPTEAGTNALAKNGLIRATSGFYLSRDQTSVQEVAPMYTLQSDATGISQLILAALAACIKQGNKFGIAHAFNSFRYRDWLIYIEADTSVPPTAKRATMFLSLILLQIGRALNSRMTFYFPNMSNEKSDDITDDDAAEDQALKELWQTKNWADAERLINMSSLLQKMGLPAWLHSLEARLSMENLKATRKDKHILLLNEVRDRRFKYHRGWSQSELDTSKLMELFEKAWKTSDEQPLCRNSLRAMYERLTDLYKLRRSSKNSQPTTAAVITASPIQATEVEAIRVFQRETLDFFKKGQTEVVKGQVTEFIITTYAFTGNMDAQSKKCYDQLDTQFEDNEEEDFLDTNFINEDMFLQYFLAPLLLMKMFNGHEKRVDSKVKFGVEKDKYGKDLLSNNGGVVIPGVSDVKIAIGEDDSAAGAILSVQLPPSNNRRPDISGLGARLL